MGCVVLNQLTSTSAAFLNEQKENRQILFQANQTNNKEGRQILHNGYFIHIP
jgi:hypothetical protein